LQYPFIKSIEIPRSGLQHFSPRPPLTPMPSVIGHVNIIHSRENYAWRCLDTHLC